MLTHDLKKLEQSLAAKSEDARMIEFSRIFRGKTSDDRIARESILKCNLPTLKVLYSRFLRHIDDERAVTYLCKLLEDNNKVVFDSAKRAYEANHNNRKIHRLRPLINSVSFMAQEFSILTLCTNSDRQIILPLLKMLQTADEDLKLIILRGLRYLPDPRTEDSITKFLEDKNEEVRFAATAICCALLEDDYLSSRKILHKSLADISARIRHLAAWGLRQTPSKRDIKILMTLAAEDSDEITRRECVKALAINGTADVIFFLIELATKTKSNLTELACESALLQLPWKTLRKGVQRAFSHNDKRVRYRAFLIFANHQRGSDKSANLLHKKLANTKDPAERSQIIEAIGYVGSPTSLPILNELLNESMATAYTAMNGILHIHRISGEGDLQSMLANEQLPPLLRQSVLQYCVRSRLEVLHQKNNITLLVNLLNHSNPNVRHLSSCGLTQSRNRFALGALLDYLRTETDPLAIKYVCDALILWTIDEPEMVGEVLANKASDDYAYNLVAAALKGAIQKIDRPLRLFIPFFASNTCMQSPTVLEILADLCIDSMILGTIQLKQISENTSKINYDLFVNKLHEALLASTYKVEITVEDLLPWLDSKTTSGVIRLLGWCKPETSIRHLSQFFLQTELASANYSETEINAAREAWKHLAETG